MSHIELHVLVKHQFFIFLGQGFIIVVRHCPAKSQLGWFDQDFPLWSSGGEFQYVIQ